MRVLASLLAYYRPSRSISILKLFGRNQGLENKCLPRAVEIQGVSGAGAQAQDAVQLARYVSATRKYQKGSKFWVGNKKESP